jgi:predicted NUDIX family NTP pyrophosphohydrolase
LQVFLVHPGGPFWARKDLGAWSLPKGEYAPDEDPLAAAFREFEEETGVRVDPSGIIALGEVEQSGGKRVTAWALERDLDPEIVKSNMFEIEWPPKSGARRQFPEIDRAGWFSLPQAKEKILKGQAEFLRRLVQALHLPAEVLEDPF